MKNNFLLRLSSQLTRIRELLGWTQEELSHRLGISRTSIVKIENLSIVMPKYTALALYTIVFGEINKRKEICKKLILSLVSLEGERPALNLFDGSILQLGINNRNYPEIMLMTAGYFDLLPDDSLDTCHNEIMDACSVLLAFKYNMGTSAIEETQIERRVIKLVYNKINEWLPKLELDLCSCFLLKNPDMAFFIRLIERF
ncbi:MAG: transcriptional regulator with XRE-family HTH domain [Clostridium sp.]|jgi:transcriptional regulator with XRE-family HTH domain